MAKIEAKVVIEMSMDEADALFKLLSFQHNNPSDAGLEAYEKDLLNGILFDVMHVVDIK